MCPEWINLSHAVTGGSTAKGCVLKNSVPVTPLLCNSSFPSFSLAFDLWVL
jgi:hypothetical protein